MIFPTFCTSHWLVASHHTNVSSAPTHSPVLVGQLSVVLDVLAQLYVLLLGDVDIMLLIDDHILEEPAIHILGLTFTVH